MTSHRFVLYCLIGWMLAAISGCSTVTSQPSGTEDLLAASRKSALVTPPAHPRDPEQAPKWELHVPDNPPVDYWVRQYSVQKRKSFQTLLERASVYVAPSQEVFSQYGLPKDLIYVALVESGFSPRARSHAKAVGMWQFIPATGKRFGLEQNQWVDERCHPMKSARAAAEYLSFLYDSFGSWPLALAGYNAGENAVQRALDQSGHRTFWELEAGGYLPAETRDYVPKVLAAVKIIRNYSHYGFHFYPERRPKKHQTVSVPGGTKLAWIGRQIGVCETSLQACNPELLKPVTPPGCSSYELCLPEGNESSVLAALVDRALQEQPPKNEAAADASEPVKPTKTKSGGASERISPKEKDPPKNLASRKGRAGPQLSKEGQRPRSSKDSSSRLAASSSMKAGKSGPTSSKSAEKKASNAAQKASGTLPSLARKGETQGSAPEKSKGAVRSARAQDELKPPPKLVPGSQVKIATNQRDSAPTSKKAAKK